jgi:hypothetical protein
MCCFDKIHTSRDYLFFLGGHDAEMVAIKEILIIHNIQFYDNFLTWGAKLSAYKKELKFIQTGQVPVFVELTLDIKPPDGSIIIDHHNENSGKNTKTSLEQTAELLKIQLTRRQFLISANDRGYIEEMKQSGAANEEIEEIRKFDRVCQGVTEDDELNAEISIKNNMIFLNRDTVFIESLTNKTSPIVDRIHNQYKNIFIKTPNNQISYYGKGAVIDKLKMIYGDIQSKIPSVKFWYGGSLPESGYFGANHFYQEAIKWIT